MGFTLDHVGFILRDLGVAASRWEKLGFTLSRRSAQMGRLPGRDEMTAWGTSNQCVIFENEYLELIGVTDPQKFNPWKRFIDRFEGPHIIALRCENADRAYADLNKRIEYFDPPIQRLRRAPYGEGTRLLRFRNIFSHDDKCKEGRYIVIEHQTPEVIWQKSLMSHRNGAKSLKELIFCASEDNGTLDRLSRITGEKLSETPGIKQFILARGCLSVCKISKFEERYPGAPKPPQAAVCAIVIEVECLGRMAGILTKSGIEIQRSDKGNFWVAPEMANGAVIEFIEATSV